MPHAAWLPPGAPATPTPRRTGRHSAVGVAAQHVRQPARRTTAAFLHLGRGRPAANGTVGGRPRTERRRHAAVVALYARCPQTLSVDWFAGAACAAYAEALAGWVRAVGVVPVTSTGGVMALSLWLFHQTGSPAGTAVRVRRP